MLCPLSSGLSQQQNGSDTSQEMSGLVLNADGVYTASIAALKLSYALSKCGFYVTRQQHLLPQSQVSKIFPFILAVRHCLSHSGQLG